MKYYVIWEEDDHSCFIEDIVTEDKFNEYIEYRLKKFLEKESRVTKKISIFDRIDKRDYSVYFYEKITEDEYDKWVERENFHWNNQEKLTSVGIGHFEYQIIEEFNKFEKQ